MRLNGIVFLFRSVIVHPCFCLCRWLEVGSWTWSWSEPVLGTVSWVPFSLCVRLVGMRLRCTWVVRVWCVCGMCAWCACVRAAKATVGLCCWWCCFTYVRTHVRTHKHTHTHTLQNTHSGLCCWHCSLVAIRYVHVCVCNSMCVTVYQCASARARANSMWVIWSRVLVSSCIWYWCLVTHLFYCIGLFIYMHVGVKWNIWSRVFVSSYIWSVFVSSYVWGGFD